MGDLKDELSEGGGHPQGVQTEPHGPGAWAPDSKEWVWWSSEVVKYDATLGNFSSVEQLRRKQQLRGDVDSVQLEQQQRGEVRAGHHLLLSSETREVMPLKTFEGRVSSETLTGQM